MAIEDALRALRDNWVDVLAQLDPDQQRQLRILAGRLGGPGHLQAANALCDLLVEGLPPDHAVRRALSQGYLFQAAPMDWAQFRADLVPLDLASAAGTPATGAGSAAEPDRGTVLAQVIARLLRAPALTEAEVRSRGADPGDPDLIRLSRPDGGVQWPEFQFAPGVGALPVVRAVNDVLDAAHDPVGAADWWLSRNVWLDGQPSTLIGVVPDDHLVSAARVLSAEA